MSNKTPKENIREWIQSIIIAIVVTIPIVLFASPTYVSGVSMQSVLGDKDILISERITKIRENFEHGDIVVFDAKPIDDKAFIKRVIGLPNDTVEIKEGHVYVNGQLLKEEYLKDGTDTFIDVNLKVPEGKLFVLGDNRGNSQDSRMIGCISMDKVKTRAYFRVFPFNKMGQIK